MSWPLVVLIGLVAGCLASLAVILWVLLSLVWLCESINRGASHLVSILSSLENLTETIDKQTSMYARRIGNGSRGEGP